MSKGWAGWTDEADAKLRCFAAEGKTFAEAAEAMGRSFGSVKSRSAQMRISFGGRGSKAASHRVRKTTVLIAEGALRPVNDGQYIEDALRLGGFPRIEIIAGKSAWIWPAPVRAAA